MPMAEWDINGGRKRIDIIYMNDARSGFFQQRRDQESTGAAMVIVECKNYTKEINNPEIDQLLGRFDRNRGKFGMLLCRKVGNDERLLERCRDLAKSGSGYIIALTDEDLQEMLAEKSHGNDNKVEAVLVRKFRDLIS